MRPEHRIAHVTVACAILACASLATARPAEVVSVPLPADQSATALRASLDAEWRHALDEEQWVVTFEEEAHEDADGVRMRALSIGVLDAPPATVRGLLARTGDYPSWVPLNPSYKSVRIAGTRRMHAEVGSSRSRRARESLTYDLEPLGTGMTWRLIESRSPLRVGSYVSFHVVPHPERDGASLVLHEQVALLPDSGRMTRYLTSDDKSERNRFWKDANKHARRTHFAMDAALRHPEDRERLDAYVSHYQREFGEPPYWAK